MAGEAKNYYEVLGVTETATIEEIKKRYRSLARQHHPDVNPNDPNAARKFTDVAEAYRILSDATTRGVHDFELKSLRDRQEAARRRAATPNTGAGAGVRPNPTPQAAGPAAPSRASNSNAGSESARLVAQAQAAFVRHRLAEARTLAEQALRLNRRNAQAYEILGDVFRLQNRADDAMNMYSMSLQINPRNPTVMERLERMARASTARHGGSYTPPPRPSAPYTPRPTSSSSPAAGSSSAGGYRPTPPSSSGPASYASRPMATSAAAFSDAAERRRPLGLLLWGVAGYGAVFLAILYVLLYHGEAPPGIPTLTWISSWNLTIVGTMVLCGLVLGSTMSGTLAIRRIEDELILPSASGGGPAAPLGAVLIVFSVLSFYAAALVYLLIQYFQEAVTPSVLRAFGAVFAVVCLLSFAYEPGHMQVFWFGGNVVFLSYLVGWAIGDLFRPYGV